MTYDIKKIKEASKTYVGLVDVLFAVILGQSFALHRSEQGFKPYITQPLENAFVVATLLLAYGLVITSWIGYHKSVQAYPVRSPFRFVIDVSLLFLYYFAFVNISNFEAFILILFCCFLLYSGWDATRIYEYFDKLKQSKSKWFSHELLKRLIISIVFAVVFFVTTWTYPLCIGTIGEGTKWAYFALVTFLLILYRYVKRSFKTAFND